jgi:hypothetical protein
MIPRGGTQISKGVKGSEDEGEKTFTGMKSDVTPKNWVPIKLGGSSISTIQAETTNPKIQEGS